MQTYFHGLLWSYKNDVTVERIVSNYWFQCIFPLYTYWYCICSESQNTTMKTFLRRLKSKVNLFYHMRDDSCVLAPLNCLHPYLLFCTIAQGFILVDSFDEQLFHKIWASITCLVLFIWSFWKMEMIHNGIHCLDPWVWNHLHIPFVSMEPVWIPGFRRIDNLPTIAGCKSRLFAHGPCTIERMLNPSTTNHIATIFLLRLS